MKKQIVYMMVGLPGSGKSTVAQEIVNKDHNAIIVSSDAIRKELLGNENDQTNQEKVFDEYYKRLISNLLDGKNVILDATNITKRARSRTFAELTKIKNKQIEVIAYVVNTKLEDVYIQNHKRSRVVPDEVIKKFLLSYQHPQKFEGFNKIIFYYPQKAPNSDKISAMLETMDKFDQNNPWHTLTLGKHCKKVASNYLPFLDSICPEYYAGLWHDVGKLFTQTTDEKGISHYYNHAQYGTYYIASNLDLLPQMSTDKIQEVLFYINWHMQAHEWEKFGDSNKYIRIFGEERYKGLMQFSYFDTIAKE